MRVLIVQSDAQLGAMWRRHLVRLGADVTHVETGEAALTLVQDLTFDVIVIDLVLSEGSPLTISDFVEFRRPETNIVFVTDTTFFSDGSIFSHCANARAIVGSKTPPEDIAEIVHHYGSSIHRDSVVQDSPA